MTSVIVNYKRICIFYAILATIFWGLNMPFAKLGIAEIPSIFWNGLRFFLAGLVGLPFILQVPWRELKKYKFHLCMHAFILAIMHFVFLFLGATGLSGSMSMIVIQLGVPIATILAVIFLKEKVGVRRSIGIFVAFVGCIFLVGGNYAVEDGQYVVYLLIAAFGWGAMNIYMRFLKTINAMALNSIVGLLGAVYSFILSYFFEEGQISSLMNASAMAYWSIFYGGVVSLLLGYSLWGKAIQGIGVSGVVPFSLLAPFVSTIVGVFVMGETFTWLQCFGAVLMGIGVMIIQVRLSKILFYERTKYK